MAWARRRALPGSPIPFLFTVSEYFVTRSKTNFDPRTHRQIDDAVRTCRGTSWTRSQGRAGGWCTASAAAARRSTRTDAARRPGSAPLLQSGPSRQPQRAGCSWATARLDRFTGPGPWSDLRSPWHSQGQAYSVALPFRIRSMRVAAAPQPTRAGSDSGWEKFQASAATTVASPPSRGIDAAGTEWW